MFFQIQRKILCKYTGAKLCSCYFTWLMSHDFYWEVIGVLFIYFFGGGGGEWYDSWMISVNLKLNPWTSLTKNKCKNIEKEKILTRLGLFT